MQIQITRSVPGSPNGIDVIDYQAGETVEMPDHLAAVYVREGWGKAIAAPENKAIKHRETKAAKKVD